MTTSPQSGFIETAFFCKVEQFISTPISIPIFVYGPTGLGKTTAIIEAARKHNRKAIKFNVSVSTTVDDMVGGIRLENGNTEFKYGPLINAMLNGDIIVLDELDAGDPVVLMELQPILEGKSYTIKKTGEVIEPKDGFMIIATGNTKGTGDQTGGEYVGTNVLNKAFRDRFAAWIEYNVPTTEEIVNILKAHATQFGFDQPKILKHLAKWFTDIYSAYEKGGISQYLSVRKIILTAKMMKIFGSEKLNDEPSFKAVNYAVSTFDDPDIQESIVKLWEIMIDEDIEDVAIENAEQSDDSVLADVFKNTAWNNPTGSPVYANPPPASSKSKNMPAILDEAGNVIPYTLDDL